MNVREYLKRIGVDIEDIHADYQSLQFIQMRHMLSVPFENLDIINSRPIEINLEAIYQKIVVSKRGGYCYELNGLLGWLLQNVGFSVSLVSGRVHHGDGTYGPEFDHMALLVHLEKDYIVDVGFGDSVRSPLQLSGDIVTDVSGSYRITSESNSETLCFQKLVQNEWITEFKFTKKPRKLDEFYEMNQYQQTSSESHFTKKLICSLATPNGRITISGDSLIETINSIKTKRMILSSEERNEILKQRFGIIL
ncbi:MULTISPECIES: arylamine N-acetyltransferase family protein [Aneurinibacillus]|uniref:Arylamine N-acetyltransferase n=1 Tax=Aneurinibacillus thermoaerophilus TaxID=143495 RepID=A0A1G8ED14_ANETH|nr:MULTISPECIES: arylamine N-acetyltransferase [Aneurinibacillus]MED0676334.1 arylamine N-acetyltransferase [Aneurinibacillus thermoaerophilus]MED0679859.1 arylamine N-acetyltransferase [Aneurinibacillus thermoaerophilus]MED0737901.1 arylamine N-acetyltransferase [Aneurinibacillus thermoaerophilus]MED0758867.1 arylamine N-acetyltransferase [Aneurinibacillus thermoaerophilus]MED0761848.1 arylamine N-acetyltransferase [Aneurinibacillus thermoaerophilus]